MAQSPANKKKVDVIYAFPDVTVGRQPSSALAMDSAGNLYGSTLRGGSDNLGIVYELTPGASGYTEQTLFQFARGGPIGTYPGPITMDNEGNLWGMSLAGVFELIKASGYQPEMVHPCGHITNFSTSPNTTVTIHGPEVYVVCATHVLKLTPAGGAYTTTELYTLPDGSEPNGDLVVDSSRNVFGTTVLGGASGNGMVYELSPTNSGYTETDVHDFQGNPTDGAEPHDGVTFGKDGVIYGTTDRGGLTNFNGTVYQLAPSGSGGYTESVLFDPTFFGDLDGAPVLTPTGSLVVSSSSYHGGIIELIPNGSGGFTNRTLGFVTDGGYVSQGKVLVDLATREVYETTYNGGNRGLACSEWSGCGAVFRVSL